MRISPTTRLSKPTGDAKISRGLFSFLRTLNRQREYDIVIREFKNSGISRATLARRMGRAPEVISRLLNRPSNWEADTFSDLLFAISGALPTYDVQHVFERGIAEVPPQQVKPAAVPVVQAPHSAMGTNSHTAQTIIDELKRQAFGVAFADAA